jgi:hypothetical protein
VAATHGSSEPVNQNSRHAPKPNTASAGSVSAGLDTTCAAPNSSAVSRAPIHGPRHPDRGGATSAAHRASTPRRLPAMLELFALDDAAKATIALIAVFGVVFPALAGGLIAFAAAQAAAERQENQARRSRRRR